MEELPTAIELGKKEAGLQATHHSFPSIRSPALNEAPRIMSGDR